MKNKEHTEIVVGSGSAHDFFYALIDKFPVSFLQVCFSCARQSMMTDEEFERHVPGGDAPDDLVARFEPIASAWKTAKGVHDKRRIMGQAFDIIYAMRHERI